MAQRRMFSPDIVCSDAFLDMPASTQALYYSLGMFADDDGFVSPRKIMRMLGAAEDDLKILMAKRFVLQFEDGVIVIKHWRMNNLVRKDWYKPTLYTDHKAQLFVKKGGIYTLDASQGEPLVNEPLTNSLTQVRLGKVRLDKTEGVGVASMKYLKDIPAEHLKEITTRFEVSPAKVRSVAEDLILYCQRKGKTYKNYKAFLLNAIKREHRERPAPKFVPPPDKPLTPEQEAENKRRFAEHKKAIDKIVGKKTIRYD